MVVGGGSRHEGVGNGRATCVLLAREGAQVAVLDRDVAAGRATAELIAGEGGQAMVVVVDATDEASCQAATATVVGAWGGIDVLVNVVGAVDPRGTAVTVDLAEWDEGLRRNVTSMLLMSRQVIPSMVGRGGGSIVNIGSIGGLVGTTNTLMYATSKGGVLNLTRAMAADHGADGVRVNCISPGLVHTPMSLDSQQTGPMTDDLRERRRTRSMLRTEGSGWDVGYAALFLASDESRWITAQNLVVDAGATALFAF